MGLALAASLGIAQAGPAVEPFTGSVNGLPEIGVAPADPSWLDVTISLPGWLMGVEGTVGVQGLETHVDAGVDDLLKELDMIAAGGLELRHGKFGVVLDGLYGKMSMGGTSTGPLVSDVSVGFEQVLAEGALTYRLWEGDRGWVDFLAGARYVYLQNDLSLTVDPAGVRETSERLSARVFDRAAGAVRREVTERLPGILAQTPNQTSDLRARALRDIERRVSDQVDLFAREMIRDRIDSQIGSAGPGVGQDVANSGAVRSAIRRYTEAKVARDIEAARAKSSAAVAQARASARKKAERRLAKAEDSLARALEDRISDRVQESPVSASKDWVDPFVGLRGQCQLSDALYLAARADIGGFGVSSDLTWNLYGALGIEVSDRAAIELGYRYLSLDYESGGFRYDMAQKGPFIGMLIEF